MSWKRFFRVILPLFLLPLTTSTPLPSILARAIGQPLLDDLVLYSQYAAAAYCRGNNDSPNTKLVCPSGNCPLVEAADTSTASEFQNSFLTDNTGYLALSHSARTIILAFRGSQSVQNFLADASFAFLPTPYCAGCFVHGGFVTSWREGRAAVLADLAAARAAHPDYAIVITGHSLGGALASLAAADIRSQGIPAALYTYGSPRVGNAAWASYVTAQPGGNYRVTHGSDPVPRLAPFVLGSRHISPEYYIKDMGDGQVPPQDVKVLEGGLNLMGNSGTFWFDIEAHLNYFGKIASCGDGLFSS
jgi:hypothetical protein